jgi:predicted ATP-dependent serine protease
MAREGNLLMNEETKTYLCRGCLKLAVYLLEGGKCKHCYDFEAAQARLDEDNAKHDTRMRVKEVYQKSEEVKAKRKRIRDRKEKQRKAMMNESVNKLGAN